MQNRPVTRMAAGFWPYYAKCVFEGYVLHQRAKSAAKPRQCWLCVVIRGESGVDRRKAGGGAGLGITKFLGRHETNAG